MSIFPSSSPNSATARSVDSARTSLFPPEQLLSIQACDTAARHIADILQQAFEHQNQASIVVYDRRCALTVTLAAAYQRQLPDALMLDFDATPPDQILAHFAALQAGALVVLIQSTHFRLEAYRLRVELFKRGLKVIEHPHLSRMPGAQGLLYIDSLAYDKQYLRHTGTALQAALADSGYAVIGSGNGCELRFAGPLEPARLNVGDYSAMNNVGGQFPIGEVFTESVRLEDVSGKVNIFIFGDTRFLVNRPARPITLVVEQGQVVAALNSTAEFDQVLANIRADDGVIWVRELGFGLNRAFTSERVVDDIGTYERMCGIHLSLGSKHGSYAKPHIKRGEGRHHVDVFAITESVNLGGREVYRDGAWVV